MSTATDRIYAFMFSLYTGPCAAMKYRGLRVNDELRQERMAALAAGTDRYREVVRPIVESVKDKLQKTDLYWDVKTCKSCRNGSKKKLTCTACGGTGKQPETFTFNLGSEQQLKDVLYNGLGLPKRTRDNVLKSDEEALQSLLSHDTTGFVQAALKFAKQDTLRAIYARMTPAKDGHVRTVLNPGGAYNGRFSSAGAFYVPNSTNLQNLPNEALAAIDPDYGVRDCIIPDEGEVFLYADLSAADQWSVAALAEEDQFFEYLRQGRAHRVVGSAIYGVPESEIPKGSPRYFVSKTANHAVCFGEGPNRLWREINKDSEVTGIGISLPEATRVHKGIHAFRPNLDKVWWNRVEHIMRNGALMRNAHGRECQFYPKIAWDTGEPDAASLRAMVAWEPASNTVDTLNGTPETDPRRSRGMMGVFHREHETGMRLLLQGHDSILVGCPTTRVAENARFLKEMLEREITVNDRTFVIPAEVFLGETSWGHLERLL